MLAPDDLAGAVLGSKRLARVKRLGALIFDVDDTLLDRGGPDPDVAFASGPGALISRLLLNRFTVGLVTGHGWEQLESRLVRYILAELRSAPSLASESARRLRVYANCGATRLVADASGFQIDKGYGDRFRIQSADLMPLREIIASLAEILVQDWDGRQEWYRRTYPGFDFTGFPPTIKDREGATLSLRPVPSSVHGAPPGCVTARDRLLLEGGSLLRDHKLDGAYAFRTSGHSTLEVCRRGVSKSLALRDLIESLVKDSRKRPDEIEQALVYIGDEFDPGGNDLAIPEDFPNCLCISVAGPPTDDGVSETLLQPFGRIGLSGARATYRLISYILSLNERMCHGNRIE